MRDTKAFCHSASAFSKERLRNLQTSNLDANLSILRRKLLLLFCLSSYDMKIHNARTGSLGHLNPNGFSLGQKHSRRNLPLR